MTESAPKKPRITERVRNEAKAKRFVEELSWLLKSYSTLDIEDISTALRVGLTSGSANAAVRGYASANPNKQFLVGALPRMFMDESLFPTNEDIAQFAESVMELKIPRYGKKSKYEIIGHVVCETDSLNDLKLQRLVSALSALADGDDRVKRFVRQRKEQQFEWNAIIQELAQGANG